MARWCDEAMLGPMVVASCKLINVFAILVAQMLWILQLLLCTAEAMLFHARYNLLKLSNVTYCYCCKHDTDCFCWTTYSDWHFKKFNFSVFTKNNFL